MCAAWRVIKVSNCSRPESHFWPFIREREKELAKVHVVESTVNGGGVLKERADPDLRPGIGNRI